MSKMADLMFKIAKGFAYSYFAIAIMWFILSDTFAGPLGCCFIGLLLIFVAENIRYIIWRFKYRWKNWDNWKD